MVLFEKNISTAEHQDIPFLQQLAKHCWNQNYSDMLSQEQIDYMLENFYSTAELQKHFDNLNYFYFFIINNEGERVGFIGCESNYEFDSLKLDRLYLLRTQKGKGLGKMAIEFTIQWARINKNNRVLLNVNKKNPAVEFYKKNGFSIFSEGVFDIGKGYVMDDYIMQNAVKSCV